MKIIHTADWHIGQTFYEYDRKYEHACFFKWLLSTLKERGIDALLIAGDIFDSPNPSAESQKAYYAFLREATNENPDLQIIVIAGNHDSAARLEAPNPLLESMNVTVRGIVGRASEGEIDYERLLVPLRKGGYCMAVPYLRQGDYPEADSYSASVKALYDRLYELACQKIKAENDDSFSPIVAMGHLQATGAEISENDRSERTVIGGLECVSPDSFSDGIVYTALGHLHRRQQVSGRENVRYSGTPIPMSFAEKNNRHGVVLVDITPTNTAIELLEFDDTVTLMSIPNKPAPLSDVLTEILSLPVGAVTPSSPYLEIKVLLTEPEPSMRHQIDEALVGKSVRLARILAVTAERRDNDRTTDDEVCTLSAINPMDVAMRLFERQYGNEMPANIQKILQEAIREAEQ